MGRSVTARIVVVTPCGTPEPDPAPCVSQREIRVGARPTSTAANAAPLGPHTATQLLRPGRRAVVGMSVKRRNGGRVSGEQGRRAARATATGASASGQGRRLSLGGGARGGPTRSRLGTPAAPSTSGWSQTASAGERSEDQRRNNPYLLVSGSGGVEVAEGPDQGSPLARPTKTGLWPGSFVRHQGLEPRTR